jgi:hypothetical protein
MKSLVKFAAAVVLGLTTLAGATAFADDDDYRRDRDRYDDRFDDRGDYRDANYRGGRPERCDIDHDHRFHNRNYYDFYPRDRYFLADPDFFGAGGRGYYDRGGRFYDRPYYDRRGYRDFGRVVDRDIFPIRGFRADAIVIEEVFGGGRGYGRFVCTVTARGPDARFVPYGQLRRIANRACSRRSEIRIYA